MVTKVGIIGGGQLAWMMAISAQNLSLSLAIQTPSPDDPAVNHVDRVFYGKIDDAEITAQLAENCDIITFENEFVNIPALKKLEKKGIIFRPQLSVLEPLLDKYEQRLLFASLDIPIPAFLALEKKEQFSAFGFPVVLKARRLGYDGYGTFIIKNHEELSQIWQKYPSPSFLLEKFIPFDRELAVIAVRGITGEIRIYPVVETQQENQVCRRVIAPANVSEKVKKEVYKIAETILVKLDAVGVFGIEFFLTKDDEILVNEIAPRTHNSGHYTQEGCNVSQFEMLLRSITGLPLPEINLNAPYTVMINLLGYENVESDYREKRKQLSEYGVVHWYGKKQSRQGRKMGHINVLLEDKSQIRSTIALIESIWYS